MPTFMTQFSYTAEAWAALARKPENRGTAVAALLERLGCRMLNIYYATGDYDGLIIFEAPDGATAAAAIIAAIMPGHVKASKTSELFTMAEMIDILGKVGGIGYSAPKG